MTATFKLRVSFERSTFKTVNPDSDRIALAELWLELVHGRLLSYKKPCRCACSLVQDSSSEPSP